MCLYVGDGKRFKINIMDKVFKLIIPSFIPRPDTGGVDLKSFEGHQLKDYNDVYITAKEDDQT